MTRGQLLREVDSAELTEWMALYTIENREAGQAMQRAQAEANASRGAQQMRPGGRAIRER